jgi:serine/threonine protein kinase/Tol biopolymer transport system component
MSLATGTKLGRYEIRSKIGEGGMGEVYLAQDTKLDRKVALKILPAEVAAHPARMKRFVQEAKTASALNHPNIITIYEIDEWGSSPTVREGLNIIDTEFIEGETLRHHLKDRHMKIAETLDVGVQIASALAAAHAAGIIHRDIKPENVMIRRDGIVKVLDFGLAKLNEQAETGTIDAEAVTKALVQTAPGVVVGTAAYMSPEQVRGLLVDARTDIFSLGVVIYEMVAGQTPFGGATKSDLIVALLEREPPPLARFTPEAPAELERIVMKALAKDRDERYQTARDLLIDLKRLKQKLVVDAEIERAATPERNDVATANQAVANANAAIETVNTQAGTARPTSSAEYLVNEIKRHKAATIIVLMLFVAAVGIVAYKLSQRESSTSFQAMRISQLTTIGKVSLASVSPDGKYIAYAVDDGEQQSLWVKQVAATTSVQLVPAAPGQYKGITFTPDGNFVDYVLWEQTKNTISLYQVSALGGAPRKLIDDVHTPISFSSDGKRFAFVRANPNTGEYALVIANADGSAEQRLATRKLPDFYFVQGSPAWSLDGKTIVCPAGSFAGGFQVGVVEVRLENGAERPITPQRWFWVGQTKWLKNGTGLVLTAKDRLSGPEQIWALSYPGGEVKQLTNDLNDYRSLSLSSDSSVIAAVQSIQISSTWVAPSADTTRARQIASGRYDNLAWTPDGRIVYASSESGNPDIWIMDADGSHHKQLTFDSHTDFEPVASPDGLYVVFISDRAGELNVWRMDVDGSHSRQLTSGGAGESPYFSPDGKWVLYTNYGHGKISLWKVPTEGGNAMEITDKVSWSPVVSPDGRLIACYYLEEGQQVKLALIPFEGGRPVKMFDIILPAVRWTPDGRSLTYIVDRAGSSNIWKQPLDGGPPTQLTDFKTDRIFWFDWSRDGKQLALVRGAVSSDVVLISDTK